MRIICEKEEPADNQMEMSFDRKDLISEGKMLAPGPDTAIGEWEVLGQHSSKEELSILCPDKENFQECLVLISSWVTMYMLALATLQPRIVVNTLLLFLENICQEAHLGLHWALSIELLQIRVAPRSVLKSRPFKVVNGRHLQTSVLEKSLFIRNEILYVCVLRKV